MRRPWQVWLLFTLCILAVVPAMLWITCQVIELNRAEFAARRQAEQEEKISRALWTIDFRLTPLLAEEAARPDFVYQSLGSNPPLGNVESANILAAAPKHVLLHFELRPGKNGSSPQIAMRGKESNTATETNLPYEERLRQLVSAVSFEQLLAELPEQSLPQLTLLANNADRDLAVQQPQFISNTSVLDEAVADPAQSQQASSDDNGSLAADAEAPASRAANRRVGNDLRERNAAYQAFAQRTIVQQRSQSRPQVEHTRRSIAIREGISRPVWIGDKLLFARRVQRGNETVIQGCWLDWSSLKQQLLSEVADLLPAADLEPLHSGDLLPISRVLATLPAKLVVPPPTDSEPPAWSPIRLGLIAVWACLALAAGASAWLLQGVVTLSERRAAFVSAVTHELRTPLTTFRMYAEMLADGMVTQREQQQAYLETLRVEADRLTHLVDNVLLYARLERTKPNKNRITISIAALLERFAGRLRDRAAQAHRQLTVECDGVVGASMIATDPGAVEQIAFNLVDNACKYAVPAENRSILLSVETYNDRLLLAVRDFGPGLSSHARRRLFHPFSKSSEEAAVTAPGVGLGLALCKRLAADLGGRLEFFAASPGARFVLTLPR